MGNPKQFVIEVQGKGIPILSREQGDYISLHTADFNSREFEGIGGEGISGRIYERRFADILQMEERGPKAARAGGGSDAGQRKDFRASLRRLPRISRRFADVRMRSGEGGFGVGGHAYRGPIGRRNSGRGCPARWAGLRNDGPLGLSRESPAKARVTHGKSGISATDSK